MHNYNQFKGRHQQVISGIEISGIWNLRNWNWNWNWNLRNWNWNWNWNLSWVVELELELELKITELELELNWKNGIDPNPATKIHIFTKGFKHIECGHFLRDHAGFHEHNEPRVVLDKLWHDIINSHTVTKHACTFSCLPLATQYNKYTITLQ